MTTPTGRQIVINGADDSGISQRDLEADSIRLSQLFHSYGLASKDRIAILMENRTDFLTIALAAQRSGLYYTPVNWHLTADEASHIVSDCGATLLITSSMLAELATSIAQRSTHGLRVLSADQGTPHASIDDALISLPADSPTPPAIEGYYVFYSSGTTGRPKGIVIDRPEEPFGTGLVLEKFMSSLYGFDSNTVYYSPGPLYHAAPLGWSLGTVRLGGSAVIGGKFDARDALEVIARHQVTHVQFTPTMMVRIMKLDPAIRQRFDLSSLRTVIHAGAPCPPLIKRQFIEWLGPVVHEYYSGSEGAGMTAIDSKQWLEHPGSVGRPIYGEIHILDDDDAELAVGEVGRVFFGGTPNFRYSNDAAKTADSYSAQGFATIGDLGHVDPEGFLYLADRRNDLIISGGVNIYPREVEDMLITHPNVRDVAVVPIPDEEWGQSVLAVVEPAGNERDGHDLIRYCRDRLAHYKCPRDVKFVDVLPRLPSGKLLKRRLLEQLHPET